MKYKIVSISIIIMGLSIGGLSGCTNQQTDAPIIKIGLAVPLTGEEANIGQDMRKGAKMAVKEWNKKGGIFGKKIQLIKLDDKSDPNEAVAIAEQFVANPAVIAIVGHLKSANSMAALKVYREAKILLVTPSSTYYNLTTQGLIKYSVADKLPRSFVAKYFIQNLSAKRMVILDDKTQYRQGIAEMTGITFPTSPLAQNLQIEIFAQKFRTRFNTEFGFYALFGYLATNRVLDAIERANSTKRDKVIRKFNTITNYDNLCRINQLDKNSDTSNENIYSCIF